MDLDNYPKLATWTPEIEPGGGPTLAGNIWWRRPDPHGSQILKENPK